LKGGKEVMKKILSLILVLSLVLGVSGFVSGVESDPQDINVEVSPTSSIDISPGTIIFPSTIPGSPTSLDNAINFSAGENSNEDMTIIVSEVTGVFSGNIQVALAGEESFGSLESFTDTLECITDGVSPCTYNDIVLDAELLLPPGTPAGTKTGTITYTVTGAPPEL
jgi:hypothetical protein